MIYLITIVFLGIFDRGEDTGNAWSIGFHDCGQNMDCHRISPSGDSFKGDPRRDEIRRKMSQEGLDEGVKSGSISAHLSDHLVANVPASSGKYRMLFEDSPGNLRLFRPGDLTHPSRLQRRRPSKSAPAVEKIPISMDVLSTGTTVESKVVTLIKLGRRSSHPSGWVWKGYLV